MLQVELRYAPSMRCQMIMDMASLRDLHWDSKKISYSVGRSYRKVSYSVGIYYGNREVNIEAYPLGV